MEWRVWITWFIIFCIAYSGYYIELLTPESIKLIGSTKIKITKDKNRENKPRLEIYKVVLVHFNIVKNNHQQDSRDLYIFVLNKSFGQVVDI